MELSLINPNLAALQQLSLAEEVSILEYTGSIIMSAQQELDFFKMKRGAGTILSAEELNREAVMKKQTAYAQEINTFMQDRIDRFMAELFPLKNDEDPT